MSQAYTADTPFRLAVMGDSWVTDVKVTRHGRAVRSPTGEALRQAVTRALGAVDFFVAGFPGASTDNLLDLCHTTTIRNAACLSAECYSLKCGAARQCHLANLPTFEDALWVPEGEDAPDMQEAIDVAVLIIGSNDLLYDGTSAACIVENILAMKHALNDRGVEVLVCTISAQQLGADAQKVRQMVNHQLRKMDFVIDLDPLFRSRKGRQNGHWHLNYHGYKSLGRYLGSHVLKRFGHLEPMKSLESFRFGNGRDAIQVKCTGTSFKARLMSGTYTETKTTCNQKVYQKIGRPKVYLFQSHPSWTGAFQGWWIGPDPELKQTAWAFTDQEYWDHDGLLVVGWWTFGPGLPRLEAPPKPYFDISVLKRFHTKRRRISEEQWTRKVTRRRQMLEVKYPQWRYFPERKNYYYHACYEYHDNQYYENQQNQNEWNENPQNCNEWNDNEQNQNGRDEGEENHNEWNDNRWKNFKGWNDRGWNDHEWH